MIGFDVDGVIANSYPEIAKQIFLDTGYFPIKGYGSTWDTIIPKEYPQINMETPIIRALHNIDCIEAYPCSKEILPRIYKYLEEPIIFITARNKSLKEPTIKWIEKNFPTIDFRIFFSDNKFKIISDNKIDIFVEDRLKTVNFLAKHIITYLVNRPYNSGRYTDYRIKRINDLKEFWLDIQPYLKEKKKCRC